jgi:hypothetical protein
MLHQLVVPESRDHEDLGICDTLLEIIERADLEGFQELASRQEFVAQLIGLVSEAYGKGRDTGEVGHGSGQCLAIGRSHYRCAIASGNADPPSTADKNPIVLLSDICVELPDVV